MQQVSNMCQDLALEHVVHVPKASLSKKQIVNMLLCHYDYSKVDQFKKLDGFTNDDGSRNSMKSTLDAYFSEHDVSNTLCECGMRPIYTYG